MTIVDPLLVPIPKEFLIQKDKREFFERLIRTVDQLRERTGGAADEVQETGTRELYPWIIDEKKTEVINLNHETKSEHINLSFETKLREFNAVSTSVNYTAIPWDWINAKSRSAITFPEYPSNGDEIIVRNGDGSTINILGNGKRINGSSTGRIYRKSTSIRFKYFLDDNEWFAI